MVLRRLGSQRVRPCIKVSVLFGLMKTKPASMRSSATGEYSAVDSSSELTAPIVRSPAGRDFEKAGVTISTCCAPMKTFRIQHRISNGSTANGFLFLSPFASTDSTDMVGSFLNTSTFASGLAAASAVTPTSAPLFVHSLRKRVTQG